MPFTRCYFIRRFHFRHYSKGVCICKEVSFSIPSLFFKIFFCSFFFFFLETLNHHLTLMAPRKAKPNKDTIVYNIFGRHRITCSNNFILPSVPSFLAMNATQLSFPNWHFSRVLRCFASFLRFLFILYVCVCLYVFVFCKYLVNLVFNRIPIPLGTIVISYPLHR